MNIICLISLSLLLNDILCLICILLTMLVGLLIFGYGCEKSNIYIAIFGCILGIIFFFFIPIYIAAYNDHGGRISNLFYIILISLYAVPIILYHLIIKKLYIKYKIKKLTNTKYYIKSIDKDKLLSNKNTYIIIKEYKGYKKIIDKFDDQTQANYALNTYVNEQKSYINKHYNNLNNKIKEYINNCDYNTINLLINTK